EEYRTKTLVNEAGKTYQTRLMGCPPLKASRRKFHLFGCACCGQIAHLLPHMCYGRCLDFGLRYADEEVSLEDSMDLLDEARDMLDCFDGPGKAAAEVIWMVSFCLCDHFEDSVALAVARVARQVQRIDAQQQAVQVVLLRDIFGNPFRPFPCRSFPA